MRGKTYERCSFSLAELSHNIGMAKGAAEVFQVNFDVGGHPQPLGRTTVKTALERIHEYLDRLEGCVPKTQLKALRMIAKEAEEHWNLRGDDTVVFRNDLARLQLQVDQLPAPEVR